MQHERVVPDFVKRLATHLIFDGEVVGGDGGLAPDTDGDVRLVVVAYRGPIHKLAITCDSGGPPLGALLVARLDDHHVVVKIWRQLLPAAPRPRRVDAGHDAPYLLARLPLVAEQIQRPHDRPMPCLGGEVARRFAALRASIGIGARVEQEPHEREIAILCRAV